MRGHQVVKGQYTIQAVNPANNVTMNCNRKQKSRGKWITTIISRHEGIIGLVKPLLPKPTMKPHVIYITIIPLVSLRITCV